MHTSNVEMAWKYNGIYKLCGVVALIIFAVPVINAENIDCYGKSFYCVNSTHFMICVDIGGTSSSTVDNFIIECPPSTECHISNKYECEFPSSTILTTNLQSGDVANENEFGFYGITTKSPWESTDATMVLAPKYDERPYGNLQDIRAGKSAYIESYFDTPTIKPKYEEYSKFTNEGTVTPTLTPSTVKTEYLSKFNNDGKYTTASPNYDDINADRPAMTNENYPETNTEVTPRFNNVTRDFMLVKGQDTVIFNSFENYTTNTNDNNWVSPILKNNNNNNNNNTTIMENKDLPSTVFDKMSEVEFIQSKPDSNSSSLQVSQKYSEIPVPTIPTYPIKINTEKIINNKTEYGMYNTPSTIGVTNYNIEMLSKTYNGITNTPLTTNTNEFPNISIISDIPVLFINNATGINRVDSTKNLSNVIEEEQSLVQDNLAFTEKEATSPHSYNTDLFKIIKVKPVDTDKDLKSSNPLDIVDKNKQLNFSDVIENFDESGLTKMLLDLVNIKEFDETTTNKSEHSPTDNKFNLYNSTINDLNTSFNLTEIENANIDEIEKVKSLPILTDSVFKNNTKNIKELSGTSNIEPAQKLNVSTYNLSDIVIEKNNAQLQDERESALDMDEHNQAAKALILSNNSTVWYEEMHEKRQEILSELESKNTSNLTVIDKSQTTNRDNTKVIKKTYTMEPIIDVQASIKPNFNTQENNSVTKSNVNNISNSNLSVSIDNANFSEIRVSTPSYTHNALNSSEYSTLAEAEAIKSNKTLRETRSNSELDNTTPKFNNETMSPVNDHLLHEAFDEENIPNENSQTVLNKEKLTNERLSNDKSVQIINSNKTLDNEESELNNKSTPKTKNDESAQAYLIQSTEPANSATKILNKEVKKLNENSLSDKHIPEDVAASTQQANTTTYDKTHNHYLSPHPSTPGFDIITLNSFDESNQTRPTRTLLPENNKNITEKAASNNTSNKNENTNDSNLELSSQDQNLTSLVQSYNNSSTAQPSKNASSDNEAKNQNLHNSYPVTSTVTATPTPTPLDNVTFTITPDLPTANTNEETHSTWTPSSTATTSSSNSFNKEVLVKKPEVNSNLTNKTIISKPNNDTKSANINDSQKNIQITPRDESVSKTYKNKSDQKAISGKTDMKLKKIIDILLESFYFSSNDKLANNQNNIPPRKTYNNGFTQTATFTPTATQTNTVPCRTAAKTTPPVTFDALTSYMPTSTYPTLPTPQDYDDTTFTHTPSHYYNRQTARMAVINAGGLPMFTTTAMSESSSHSSGNHFHCPRNYRGKFADKNNCRVYYTCFGDTQPVVGVCPSHTVFSEVTKLCTKNLSHCMKNNNFKCNSEGRFSDYIKKNVYYICVKAAGMKSFYKLQFQCSLGHRLEKKTVRCVTDHSGNGDDPPSSTESFSNSKSDLVAQESRQYSRSYKQKHSSHRQFQCVEEGNFPDPGDKTCRVYYECKKTRNHFRRIKRKCESDELFDKDSDVCVDAESYECGIEK